MRYYNPFKENLKKNQPTRDLETIFLKLSDPREQERKKIEKKRREDKLSAEKELAL